MLKNKIQDSSNNLIEYKRLKKLYNFFYYLHKISSKKNLFD